MVATTRTTNTGTMKNLSGILRKTGANIFPIHVL